MATSALMPTTWKRLEWIKCKGAARQRREPGEEKKEVRERRSTPGKGRRKRQKGQGISTANLRIKQCSLLYSLPHPLLSFLKYNGLYYFILSSVCWKHELSYLRQELREAVFNETFVVAIYCLLLCVHGVFLASVS